MEKVKKKNRAETLEKVRRNKTMSLFKDKTLMITGGTGSFASAR